MRRTWNLSPERGEESLFDQLLRLPVGGPSSVDATSFSTATSADSDEEVSEADADAEVRGEEDRTPRETSEAAGSERSGHQPEEEEEAVQTVLAHGPPSLEPAATVAPQESTDASQDGHGDPALTEGQQSIGSTPGEGDVTGQPVVTSGQAAARTGASEGKDASGELATRAAVDSLSGRKRQTPEEGSSDADAMMGDTVSPGGEAESAHGIALDQAARVTEQSTHWDAATAVAKEGGDHRHRHSATDRRKWWQQQGEGIEGAANQAGAAAAGPSVEHSSGMDAATLAVETGATGFSDGQDASSIPDLPVDPMAAELGTSSAVMVSPSASAAVTTEVISTGPPLETLAGVAASTGDGSTTPPRSAAPEAAAGKQEGRAADPLTRQEQVRLVQRIARSFHRLTPQGGQIQIRLHPPHLGSLAVRVRIEGRELEARLTTETATARDAILENLPALRTRLEEQGYEITQLRVEVAQNGSDAAHGDGSTNFGGSAQREQTPERNWRSDPAPFPRHRGTMPDDGSGPRSPVLNHVLYAGSGIDINV